MAFPMETDQEKLVTDRKVQIWDCTNHVEIPDPMLNASYVLNTILYMLTNLFTLCTNPS